MLKNKVMTFNALRQANLLRLPRFTDRQGNKAHEVADGSDWIPDRWCNAMVGEAGELAGELKKAARGDYGPLAKKAMNFHWGYPRHADNVHPSQCPEEVKEKIAKEAADIVTYLDILCHQFGIDLGVAVQRKFNEVSVRVGAGVYIEFDENGVLIYDDRRDKQV